MVKNVEELMLKPFSTRTTEEQLKIILEGKPRPNLPVFSGTRATDGSGFDISCYDKETWLTACEKRHTFYCWSCLLFAREAKSIWTTEGHSHYESLYEAMKQHNTATEHISAALRLQMFVLQNLSNVVTLNVVPEPSEDVQKSQRLLKQMLSLVCNIISSYPPLEDKKKLHEYVKETCTEALISSQRYNMDDDVEKTVDLLNSPKFMSDFFSSLSNMVKMKIKEEMQCSAYVSLILSEHSDISRVSKLSFVLRYVKDRKVHERFIGFICEKVPKSAEAIAKFMSDVLSGYGLEQKCIAFSCDGAVLSSAELKKLIAKMKLTRPRLLVPCHFHHFGILMEQSLSQQGKGASLFKTLSSIKKYLQGSRKMLSAFGSSGGDVVDLTLNNWDFAKEVKRHRRQMVNFFKSVVHNPDNWADDDVTHAMGFYKKLEDFETIFVLEIIFAVSGHIKELCDILTSPTPEDLFECSRLACFLTRLNGIGLKDFPYIWKQSCVEKTELPVDLGRVQQISESLIQSGVQESCRDLFEEIMINATDEIEVRFASVESLRFFQLLNSENRKKFEVPDYVRALMRTYGREFDEVQLIKELKGMDSVINEKTLHEVFEILSTENLQCMFQNVRKLLHIILTVPLKAGAEDNLLNMSGSVDFDGKLDPMSSCESLKGGSTTKFDLINFWSRLISPKDGIANDWSVISVEQDIFKHLMSQTQFFGEFLCTFRTRNSQLKLI